MFFAIIASISLSNFVRSISEGWKDLDSLPGTIINNYLTLKGIPFPETVGTIIIFCFIGLSILLLVILWKFIGSKQSDDVLGLIFIIVMGSSPVIFEHFFALFICRIHFGVWNMVDSSYIILYMLTLLVFLFIRGRIRS